MSLAFKRALGVYPDITLMVCHHHMGTNSRQLGNKNPGDSEASNPKHSLPPYLLPSKLLEKLSAAVLLHSVSWVVSTCCNSWIQVLSCSSLNIKLCQQTSKTIGNNFQNSSEAQEWPTWSVALTNEEGLVEAGRRIHRGFQRLLVSMVVALITNRSEQGYHHIASMTAGKTASQPESKHLMHYFRKKKKYLFQ